MWDAGYYLLTLSRVKEMPRRKRSSKYSLQISNFGRLRRGKGWRKYWNGESSERFGPTQFMVYYKGHYYNVDELARKTWGKEYNGMNIVPHTILLRQRSIRFRDKIIFRTRFLFSTRSLV